MKKFFPLAIAIFLFASASAQCPLLDAQGPVAACESYALPAITGISLTGFQNYYDAPGGPTVANVVTGPITSSMTLFIYDGVVGCSDEETIVITINPIPVVSFMADITAGCTPASIVLTSLPGSPGLIVSEIWDIESVGIMSGNEVNPVLTQAGTFDVTLTVTDIYGCINSLTYTEFLYAEDAPISSFIIDAPPCLPSNVSFTSTSSGATSCVWNISNGDSYNVCGPLIETYTVPGIYDVQLISYSLIGCSNSISVLGAFVVEACVGIEELSNTPKQLLKIVDLMGRETPYKPNTVLIYVYDDGSTEKVFKMED